MEKLNTVLLIDDSQAANAINTAIIEEMGFANNIVSLNSIADALAFLKKEEGGKYPIPELIILDLEMPNEDGFDFLKTYSKLSAEITNGFSPIIVILSNHISPENFTKGKDYRLIGVECILKKPLDQEDIKDILEENFDFTF
jgi:CheY-like chemotaxis protein